MNFVDLDFVCIKSGNNNAVVSGLCLFSNLEKV